MMTPEEATSVADAAIERGQALLQAALAVDTDIVPDDVELALMLAGVPFGAGAMLQILGERGHLA